MLALEGFLKLPRQKALYFSAILRLTELMWLVQGHAIKLQSRVFGFPAQDIVSYNGSSGAKIRLEFWSNSFQQNEDVSQIIENMFSSFGFFSSIENKSDLYYKSNIQSGNITLQSIQASRFYIKNNAVRETCKMESDFLIKWR